MSRRLPLLVALLFVALLPASPAAARVAPASFAGISPQMTDSEEDFELMQSSHVSSVRLPLFWSEIQKENRFISPPDFDSVDREVKLAAEYDIRIFPFLYGTPDWVDPDPRTLPIGSPWDRWAWSSFLRDVVARYGPDGSFWDENPDLPYLPMRNWEIWNEENIVTFTVAPSPRAYTKLLRMSGRVLHRADPGATVIFGGLYGRPLQDPPNIPSGRFLSRVYRFGRVKKYFDGVALHPYVADARAIPGQVENLRRIMRVHHDAHTGLYLTELGWGSDSHESRWERGLRGQARELDKAMAMLVENRRRWRVDGVWWFSWTDVANTCQFCDSAGLLTEDREAKPAWYQFNLWTGGDPDTVRRANFGD